MQRRRMVFWILGIIMLAATAHAGVGIDFDVHLGNRPAPQQPPPVVAEPPAIVLENAPEMVYVDNLGIYVAVGIPHDLFFYDNAYYYHVNGVWYRSAYYSGPWTGVGNRGIPPGLQRHRIEEIREYREHAWEDYRGRGDHFEGKHFRAREARGGHGRGEDHGRKEGHFKRKHKEDDDN